MNRLAKLASSIVAAICFAAPVTALSQAFPSKPIRVVVPFPPGAIDVYVRMMQPHMTEDLGQPLIIETRPGASGFIGAELVARSAPDGYTIMATAAGSVVTAALVSPKPPFDTLRDFAPVTLIYNSPQALVAKASLPLNSLAEVIDYAKRNPGKLSYGSTGIGAAQHVDCETFKRLAAVNIVHVPYNGFGPVLQALLGQQVDMACTTIGIVRQLVITGKVKLIATHNGKIAADLPGVPNLNEMFPGFESAPGFIGLWTPAGTSRPVLMRLHAAAVKALRAPEVRAKIEEGGAVVGANTPDEFLAVIKAAMDSADRMIKAARAAGVKFE